MTYFVVALILGLIAVAILAVSLRLLIGSWLLQWLRGSAGLALLALAVLIALAGWDLRSYQQVNVSKPIATLAFNRIDDKQFAVSMVDQAGTEQRFDITGEMWQFDVRLLRWTGAMAQLDFKPGYRPARLSGHYLSLEDEQKLQRSVIELDSDQSLFDTWAWLLRVNRQFSLLEAVSSSASYLPMADGAMYSVNIDSGGLVAHPLNERAKLAVDHWQ
jgi:hypothetical protein